MALAWTYGNGATSMMPVEVVTDEGRPSFSHPYPLAPFKRKGEADTEEAKELLNGWYGTIFFFHGENICDSI